MKLHISLQSMQDFFFFPPLNCSNESNQIIKNEYIAHKVEMISRFVTIPLESWKQLNHLNDIEPSMVNKDSRKGTCKQEPRNVTNEWCASKWIKNDSFFIHSS